jgi:hypothetical protein
LLIVSVAIMALAIVMCVGGVMFVLRRAIIDPRPSRRVTVKRGVTPARPNRSGRR